MAMTGYGYTIASTSIFAVPITTEIEDVSFGGIGVAAINVACLGDTNRVSTNISGEVTEEALVVTIVADTHGDLEHSCRDAQEATPPTVEEFTITDGEGSTWVGNAFISDVGDTGLGTKDASKFTISIQPETYFTFTAA